MSKPLKNIKRDDDRIMSPAQLFNYLSNSNLYDLLAFLVWYAKRNGLTCIECIETRNQMSGKPPDCEKCGLPTARLLNKYFGTTLIKSTDKEINKNEKIQ